MQALVTGSAGFIGSHLVDALVHDHDVRVLDDLSTGKADRVPDAATIVTGDVRNQGLVAHAMRDVDVVFHQAADVSVPASVDDPAGTDDVNVDGTLNVLDDDAAQQEADEVAGGGEARAFDGVVDAVGEVLGDGDGGVVGHA